MSAGNHAQGVALAAKKLNIKATIVMPTFAPEIKVDAVKRFGANVFRLLNHRLYSKDQILMRPNGLVLK